MKIQKLHIDSFRHLENVEFDFTYPKGHAKEGQPLDKICIIGQSATGKTSVLEFIKTGFENYELTSNKGYFEVLYNNIIITNKIKMNDSFLNLMNENPNKTILLYFTAEILSQNNFDFFSKKPKNYSSLKQINETFFKKRILEINNSAKLLWELILDDLLYYRKKLTQIGSELINNGLHLNYKKLETEMEKWKKENPNPLIELGEKCLNPILKKVNLEVDIVDTSVPIPLKPIHKDKPIPVNGLSTGTKQLLLTALPLFKLPTDNNMILIDEPERSLYPDMQIELMDYYQNLAPNAQFIVATHSPFIAAAFEPEERFILYFDEDGKVKVKNGVSPIGDDPNDILKNDFMVNYYNHFGTDAYKRYLELKEKVAKEKDPDKKKELMLEAVKLGDEYNF